MRGIGGWLASLRERSWASALPLWLFAAWAVLMVVRVHVPYIQQPSEQSVDEGYLIAAGQRMLRGTMLPYVDGVTHSGPVFMFCGALLAAIDEFSWLPVRLAAVISFSLVALGCFACGVLAKRPLAGAIAAAGVPFYASLRMAVHDAIPFNAELPAILFAVASLCATFRAVHESRARVSPAWLVAAGLFLSLGALSKQVAVLIVAPQALYVVAALLAREQLSFPQRMKLLLTYAAAVAAPALALLVQLTAQGALDDAYMYLVTYNSKIYMFPYKDASRWRAYREWFAAHPFELAATMTALGFGCVPLLVARKQAGSWVRALHRSGFDSVAVLMAAGGIVAEKASMRNMGHYEMMIIPGFSLLGGALVERAVQSVETDSRALIAVVRAVVLAPMVLVGEAAWSIKSKHLPAWSTQHMAVLDIPTAHQEPPVCGWIRAHSAPSDPIFVWGFRPQLYVSCERAPASRFVFSTFVAGYVPHWDYPKELEDTLAVPGAREMLIEELEQTKAPIIVDAARTMHFRSFRRYDVLWQYVSSHYRMAEVVGGDEVWLRNGAVAAATASP